MAKVLTEVTVVEVMPMNCAERGTSGLKTGYSTNSASPELVLAFILFTILLCDFTSKIGMNARSLKKIDKHCQCKGGRTSREGKNGRNSMHGMKYSIIKYSIPQLRWD